ncbi:DUF3093 domain-containing protein [Lentzea sp. CC55]|uniref:DUF3093 domain-containing protein n=1 Tax=Lentzea sp. CC55 TaxID=2884909 RepID=UPI0027E02095|nr:DUF3093 domain-containing protein [Lentzea sp. CC55]MCG8923853.1 DUF3093 domain-containing protein [Lentzea sp. CC55]
MSETAVTATTTFRERLYVTWWIWPLPLLAAALLAAEVHMGFPGVRSWLPYVILLPLTVVLIVRMGSTKVEVAGGELRAGDAHIPLDLLGEVEVIAPEDKRKAMGPHLDPAAYVVHRGWVKPLVRVRVNDPEDPTPYWMISTRRPEELAAAIKS